MTGAPWTDDVREAIKTLDRDVSEALRQVRLRLDGLQAQVDHTEEQLEYDRNDAGMDRAALGAALGAEVRLLHTELAELGHTVTDVANLANEAKEAAERADRGW